jgi:hypothetical protein
VGPATTRRRAINALSATAPDKDAWQYPTGTDVVEVWGERTAAGYDVINTDDFSSLTAGGTWTAQSGGGGFPGYYVGGALAVSPAQNLQVEHQDWPASDTQQMSGKFNLGSAPVSATAGITLGFNYQAGGGTDTGALGLYAMNDGSVRLVYGKRDTAGQFTVVAAAATLAANTQYEAFVARNGNNVDWRIVRVSDSVVMASGTNTLPVGAQGAFGAGVTLPNTWLHVATAAAQTITVDDYKRWQSAPERRDYFVAVTPQGGTRTVKRIFGSSGSGTFRSDFALATDLAAYALLASPTFTGTPSAPTPAFGDNATKIATTAYVDRAGINTQTGTAYTAVLADAGKVIESNNASAMTITIPPNSSVAYPVGSRLRGTRLGAGTLTIVQGAGVVLRNRIEAAGTTNRTVPAQYGMWEAYKRGTDEWVLTGDIA